MRLMMLTLVVSILTAAPAWATPEVVHGNNGGHNPKSYTGHLKIINGCDEAVMISINSYDYPALEPNASLLLGFYLYKKKIDVDVTARIELAPGVFSSTTEKVQLQADKTTEATVTCTATASGVDLDIETLRSNLAAAFARDSAVMVASGSGLGFLLLIGMLLGRTPFRLRSETADGEYPAPTNAVSGFLLT